MKNDEEGIVSIPLSKYLSLQKEIADLQSEIKDLKVRDRTFKHVDIGDFLPDADMYVSYGEPNPKLYVVYETRQGRRQFITDIKLPTRMTEAEVWEKVRIELAKHLATNMISQAKNISEMMRVLNKIIK